MLRYVVARDYYRAESACQQGHAGLVTAQHERDRYDEYMLLATYNQMTYGMTLYATR